MILSLLRGAVVVVAAGSGVVYLGFVVADSNTARVARIGLVASVILCGSLLFLVLSDFMSRVFAPSAPASQFGLYYGEGLAAFLVFLLIPAALCRRIRENKAVREQQHDA